MQFFELDVLVLKIVVTRQLEREPAHARERNINEGHVRDFGGITAARLFFDFFFLCTPLLTPYARPFAANQANTIALLKTNS